MAEDLVFRIERLNVADKEELDFKGATLFLPAVSVGHIGQLTTDLLLANLPETTALQKVGRIFHAAIEPVVGLEAEGAGLMTACEVFWAKELKYVIMHFHAPVMMRGRTEFVRDLVRWIGEQGFSQVVCFSSVFASDRIDPQLVGEPFRYLATEGTPSVLTEKLKEMEWKELERREFPAPAVLDRSEIKAGTDGVLHVPGGGITKVLYEEIQAQRIPFLALIMFASEGDNTPEALTLFQMADKLFNFRPMTQDCEANDNANLQDISPSGRDKLVVPISWTHFREESVSGLY